MSDFVVRGIDRQKYMRFRAVLTERDETMGEWLDRLMDLEVGVDAAIKDGDITVKRQTQ